jgi:hypothetical protein
MRPPRSPRGIPENLMDSDPASCVRTCASGTAYNPNIILAAMP